MVFPSSTTTGRTVAAVVMGVKIMTRTACSSNMASTVELMMR